MALNSRGKAILLTVLAVMALALAGGIGAIFALDNSGGNDAAGP